MLVAIQISSGLGSRIGLITTGSERKVMSVALPDSPHAADKLPVTEVSVRSQLENVLKSRLFCQSKRLSRFLRFVVEQSLAGCADDLKERTLAVQVFDREPAYEPASDPIVRVAAGDLRKRLAQYYVQETHTAELRITLPPGHYRPQFEWPELSGDEPLITDERTPAPHYEQPLQPAMERPSGWLASRWANRQQIQGALVASVAICVLVMLAWTLHVAAQRNERGLRAFWAPLSSDSAAILCVGDLDRDFLFSVQRTERMVMEQRHTPREVVGPGNLTALTRISNLMGKFGKPATVIVADAVSLTELRAAPAVMIGVFENPWTARILKTERFQFVEPSYPGGYNWLKDNTQPEQINWRVDRSVPLRALQRDYALITRVHSPLTGQTDFVVAGISLYGTIAASEFVTRPEYFQQFLDVAPTGWAKKDIQIVISTDLVNSNSSPPQMVTFNIR